jgi:hypothetical protein
VPKKLFEPNVIGKKSIEHSNRSAKQPIPKVQASRNRTLVLVEHSADATAQPINAN